LGGGIHKIGGTLAGTATDLGRLTILPKTVIALTGAINGLHLSTTPTIGANCHIVGGSVSNLVPNAEVQCHGTVNAGGNGANVKFDAVAPFFAMAGAA
jgi:hypothetical protein